MTDFTRKANKMCGKLVEGGGSVRKRRVKDDPNVFGPATPSARVGFRGRPGLYHLHRNWN